jgi:hypothetical protein
MLGVHNGFPGLIAGDIRELDWTSVQGWGTSGGAGLGTNCKFPGDGDLYAIARTIEAHNLVRRPDHHPRGRRNHHAGRIDSRSERTLRPDRQANGVCVQGD